MRPSGLKDMAFHNYVLAVNLERNLFLNLSLGT